MAVHKWVMAQEGEAGYKMPIKLLSVNVCVSSSRNCKHWKNVKFGCEQISGMHQLHLSAPLAALTMGTTTCTTMGTTDSIDYVHHCVHHYVHHYGHHCRHHYVHHLQHWLCAPLQVPLRAPLYAPLEALTMGSSATKHLACSEHQSVNQKQGKNTHLWGGLEKHKS